ncbi:MAG: MBL fold metallo-hydrolase, partial [Candidatus Hydrogenedens sp.]
MPHISIITLCENTVGKTGLLGEHGLSFFIQTDNHILLFDTGAGYTIIHNSKKLNLPLSSVDY